ncbi:MAG: peptide-methionine (R)-S-oxide reductase MsrB [Spirochaetota bacterium]
MKLKILSKPVLVILINFLIIFNACGQQPDSKAYPVEIKIYSAEKGAYKMSKTVIKTEGEWRKILTKEQFRILRQKGTEKAYDNEYWNNHERGIYICAGCSLDLFKSEDKYESNTGWPSFTAPIAMENIRTQSDNSLFMQRTEVVCARCGGHLGHVFNDGPKPTGLRYCMNSGAMKFEPVKNKPE